MVTQCKSFVGSLGTEYNVDRDEVPKIGNLYFVRQSIYGLTRGDIVLVYTTLRYPHFTEKGVFELVIGVIAPNGEEAKTMVFSFHDGSWLCSFEPIEWDITRKHPKFGR